MEETLISLAMHLPDFRYDPRICSFRTWMLRLTRWRIIDQFRKRLPGAQPFASSDDATAVASLDQLTGGRAPELETVWNEEWKKTLLERAVGRLKQRVNPHPFQMFDLYVLRRMPVTEVAQVLGTNIARAYLAKHRLSKLLRDEMVEAERGLGAA